VVDSPQPHVGVRDALGDLPRLVGHLRGKEPKEQPLDLRRPPSAYAQLLRSWPHLAARGRVSGNWYRNNTRDFRIFRLMAQGDRYPQALEIAHTLFNEYLATLTPPPRPGSDEWITLRDNFIPPYRNDAFHDKWRKLVADEPCWTVTAHLSRDTYSHIHYDSRQARTITIREAARLQSFPDAVDFAGNFGDQYRQIGNAVPPLLARAIAQSLLAQLRALMGGQVEAASAS
jgi:DNA (cytosine-5)-methyltransferase 1